MRTEARLGDRDRRQPRHPRRTLLAGAEALDEKAGDDGYTKLTFAEQAGTLDKDGLLACNVGLSH